MQVIKLHKGSLASATVDSPPGHRNAQGQDHASWVVKLGGKEAESFKESLKCCAEGYWTLCRSAAVLGDKHRRVLGDCRASNYTKGSLVSATIDSPPGHRKTQAPKRARGPRPTVCWESVCGAPYFCSVLCSISSPKLRDPPVPSWIRLPIFRWKTQRDFPAVKGCLRGVPGRK